MGTHLFSDKNNINQLELVTYRSDNLLGKNLRPASGNEGGVDEYLWRPGGFALTPGVTDGIPEAVIDNPGFWDDVSERILIRELL